MNLPFVLTEHSLFDMHSITSTLINSLYKGLYQGMLEKSICVSNTVRENVILRTNVSVNKTIVIPNAIDASFFKENEKSILMKDPKKVRIIVLSRITYRKGMDLLIEILPAICLKHKHVEFLICGDGPKKVLIKAIVDEYDL